MSRKDVHRRAKEVKRAEIEEAAPNCQVFSFHFSLWWREGAKEPAEQHGFCDWKAGR